MQRTHSPGQWRITQAASHNQTALESFLSHFKPLHIYFYADKGKTAYMRQNMTKYDIAKDTF